MIFFNNISRLLTVNRHKTSYYSCYNCQQLLLHSSVFCYLMVIWYQSDIATYHSDIRIIQLVGTNLDIVEK